MKENNKITKILVLCFVNNLIFVMGELILMGVLYFISRNNTNGWYSGLSESIFLQLIYIIIYHIWLLIKLRGINSLGYKFLYFGLSCLLVYVITIILALDYISKPFENGALLFLLILIVVHLLVSYLSGVLKK